MNEVLEMAEIKSKFANEWVFIDEPESDETLNVLRGRVICHSPDPDVVDRQIQEVNPHRWAVLYMGEPPEDMAFAL